MGKLAIKNLLQERLRLLTSVGGVAAAVVLVLLLEGVFAGSSEQLAAYIEHSGADVWVMQGGVSNMHMATSVLPESLVDQLGRTPGVARATPILYANNLVRTGDQQWFSYVVGVPVGATRGGPWAMRAGRPIPGPGEAIVPEIMMRKASLRIGDTVTILDRPFEVVGTSEGTFSLANSVTFISYGDMEAVLAAPGTASYILVEPAPGTDSQGLADSLRRAFPGTNALTRLQLADNDRLLVKQMGIDIIRVMSVIGFVLAVLVVGLTTYTSTVRRSREYGVVKALGAGYERLLILVAIQTLALTMLSLGVALMFAYGLIPILGVFVPEVPIRYPVSALITWGLLMGAIAFLAALLPAYRIARLEPAVVFKE